MNKPKVGRYFSLNPSHWNIRYKIIGIVLSMILLAITAMAIFSYVTFSRNIVTSTGEEMMNYGHEALQRAFDTVEGSVNALETLALTPSLVQAVEEANQAYADRDPGELNAEIAAFDQAWKEENPSVDPLVEEIAGNALSQHLQTL